MNRSKRIGSRAESRLVAYLRATGYPEAHRLALHGSTDVGDVYASEVLHLEVKAGAQVAHLTPAKIDMWVQQTRREAENSGKKTALVLARPNTPIPEWLVLSPTGESAWACENLGGFL